MTTPVKGEGKPKKKNRKTKTCDINCKRVYPFFGSGADRAQKGKTRGGG